MLARRPVRHATRSLLALALLALGAAGVDAQTVSLITRAGGYLPVGETREIPAAVGAVVIDRSADLGVGAAIELSPMFWPVDVRIGVDYTTAAKLTTFTIEGDPIRAEGSMLFFSGDLVLRPLPRLVFVRPYLLGGIGYRRESFTTTDTPGIAPPDDDRGYTIHAGLGADLEIGGVALLLEISDYVRRPESAGSASVGLQHDVFAAIGVRVGLF